MSHELSIDLKKGSYETRKYWALSNLGREKLNASFLFRKKTLTIEDKRNVKVDSNFIVLFKFTKIPLFCSKYFVLDCPREQMFGHSLTQCCPNVIFLKFSVSSKIFSGLYC